jgi:uncharacterized protein (DUF885 family)
VHFDKGGKMKRYLFCITVLLFFPALLCAQSPAENNLKALANEILDNLQIFYPVTATAKGIHKYDFRFTDYSSKSISTEISKLKKFQSRLTKIKLESLAPESQVDWKLLKSNVDIALQNLDRIKWHQKNPYMYVDDAVSGIYLILASQYAPLNERAQNIIARWKVVPDLLAQARLNVKRAAPIHIRLASEMVGTGISFYNSAAEELKNELPELSSEVDASSARAVTAMKNFQRFLATVSVASPESFAIGKSEFDYKLKNEYFLDYDADSLLKIGESLLSQTDSHYQNLQFQLDSTPTPAESVFVLSCVQKEDLLKYYNWEVEQTKLYLREKNILTVPDDIGKCEVIETPFFFRNIMSGIAYQPSGTFSPDQTGYMYARPIPDSLDEGQRTAYYKFINRRGFKGSVVHEAYPGHHLQYMMSSRVSDDVRKWQENPCYYEGWALYCEEMMYDCGFYGSDKRRYLGVLEGVMFRAARIVVDVKLHTGKMTVDQAVEWMTKALNADSNFIRIEVNRYTMTPTIPMSYLIGKTEVMKLRDALKAREGDKFALKDFHDRFLSEGMLPPRLLWEVWGLK